MNAAYQLLEISIFRVHDRFVTILKNVAAASVRRLKVTAYPVRRFLATETKKKACFGGVNGHDLGSTSIRKRPLHVEAAVAKGT
jgi:hypothetical protein